MQEFEESENFEIMRSLFAVSIAKRQITESHLHKIFRVHCEVKAMAKSRQLGQLGGPYDFNLRDIAKVKDAVEGCIQDQMHYYQFTADVDTEDEASGISFEAGQDLALSKLLDLVYAARFHEISDQLTVRHSITRIFPEASTMGSAVSGVSIDESVPDCLQIGRVYMSKANFIAAVKPLVHNQPTVEHLELLALASQTGRAVLLEGDTCSGEPTSTSKGCQNVQAPDGWLSSHFSTILYGLLIGVLIGYSSGISSQFIWIPISPHRIKPCNCITF